MLEKLWRVAYVFHPEGSPKATAFVRERAERILGGGVSQVVKGFGQMVTKRHLTGVKAKTLHEVADYYYANRDRMRYNSYLANGWPIASGAAEGACKNLVRDRFERSCMRWTFDMAEACSRCVPCTCSTTSRTTGNGTSTKTNNAYTGRASRSPDNSHAY